jgi:HD-like signal output (HDOD) protein
MTGRNAIDACLPLDTALLIHCRRVAALGQAIAHQLFLSTEQKLLLRSACLLHHLEIGGSRRRLIGDVIDEGVGGVLGSFSTPGAGSQTEQRLAEIVRFADALDCEYEASGVEGRTIDDLMSGLHDAAAGGLWAADIVAALDQIRSTIPAGDMADWQMGSFAPGAARILSLMSSATVSVSQLEEAAAMDPVTAGRLMQLANSALFCRRSPVSTLGAAVARLGFQSARKVIAATLIRPLLASPRIEPLWLHSLEAADLAEQIAERTGTIDPGEAYLCGLVHDMGALALSRLPLFDAARIEGLEDGGCPPVYAEELILRTNHGELGATLAEHWRLPAPLPDAIRHHHRPENTSSPMAHLLYLAEFLTGGSEDLPSRWRLILALDRLRLRFAEALALKPSEISRLLAAA